MESAGPPTIQSLIDQFASTVRDKDTILTGRIYAREQYARAFDALKAWSTVLNDVCPVNALPEEVLRQIFVILEEMAPMRVRQRGRRTRGWLEVSHVCRRWRTIAVEAPELWTRINLAFVESPWMAELLRRCGEERRLRVFLDASTHYYHRDAIDSLLQLLLPKRVDRLSLVINLDWLPPNFHTSGSFLPLMMKFSTGNELHLEVNSPGVQTRAFQTSSMFYFLTDEHQRPALHVLQLVKVTAPAYTYTTGANLRRLEIAHQHDRYLHSLDGMDDLNPFLDFLRSSPRLVYLKVVNGGPSVASRPPHVMTPGNPRIDLLYLEVLVLSGSTSVYEILPHLYTPVCANADVSFMRRDDSGGYIHAPPAEMELAFILPEHSHFWDGWLDDDVPMQSMNITAESKGRALRATYTFSDCEGKDGGRQRKLILRLGQSDIYTIETDISEAIQHISQNVVPSGLSELTTLHVVNFKKSLDTDVWKRVLLPMRNLSTLVLRNTDVGPVLETLRYGHEDAGSKDAWAGGGRILSIDTQSCGSRATKVVYETMVGQGGSTATNSRQVQVLSYGS